MYNWQISDDFDSIGRVGVIYGGFSDERLVSLESGACLLNTCKRMGLNVKGFDITSAKDLFALDKENLSFCLLALHGGDGEDGHVQSVLDLLGIPYIGSGVLASSACMNKVTSRLICKAAGIPVVPWQEFSGAEPPFKPDFDFPVCLKPVAGGSSIDVSRIDSVEQWLSVRKTLSHQQWMVEPWFSGVDHFVGILGDVVLPVIEVTLPKGEFFDYKNKYSDTSKCYEVVENKMLQSWMQNAYRALRCKDYARADFITVGERSWFLEMNTLPGMAPGCLLPRQAKAAGLSYEDFIRVLLQIMTEDLVCE